MAIYYVSKAGSDSTSDGTNPDTPYLTVGAACAVADNSSGNVVEILDSGQYDEGDIAILGNAITVRATGSNTPILDGDDGSLYLINEKLPLWEDNGLLFVGTLFANELPSSYQLGLPFPLLHLR